jgi:hypothetical protein
MITFSLESSTLSPRLTEPTFVFQPSEPSAKTQSLASVGLSFKTTSPLAACKFKSPLSPALSAVLSILISLPASKVILPLEVAANTNLDLCCHVSLVSGKVDGTSNRMDLTDVNFTYNNTDKTYSSFNVQGFNNFDVAVEGNSLESTTFVNIENKNNMIGYDVKAGVPGKPNVAVENSDLTIRAASFDANNNYNASIFNEGTTSFDKDGSQVVLSAGENVIIESGLDVNGNRTDFNDSNTQLAYAANSGNQYDGDLKVRGFDDLKLNSSAINNDINVTGDVDLYASQKVTLDENIESENILAISENDMELTDQAQLATENNTTLVVDEETPFSVGDGQFDMASNASINTGGQLAIYTSQRSQNNIDGDLNGVKFNPGQQFFDTAREQWLVSYRGRVGSVSKGANVSNPYTVLYKNNETVNITADCEANPELPICATNVGALDGKEFRVALSEFSGGPGEPTLASGNSSDIRTTEFGFVPGNSDYVDTSMKTSSQLQLLTSIPTEVLDLTIRGFAIEGIQGAASIMTLGISDSIIGAVTSDS